MKKNYCLSLMLLALLGMASPYSVHATENVLSSHSTQQIRKITGKVVDAAGQPIIGASVLVKASGTGAVTDLDGNFSVEAPVGSTLEVSFVGYKAAAVKVTNLAAYTVTLQDDTQALSEVVVTAMGIKKERKALGYAVSDIKSEELLKNKNTNVVNSLAGKIPGVNITQNSGAAGAGASIIIRGGNSTSEGRENQPLFVVDGIIYDNSTSVIGNSSTDGMSRSATTYSNRVMDINPEDVETMSVLKGAAAAALYGSRAADGVIIITTKKGAEGSVKVDVSSKMSTSWATKLPEAQTAFGRGYYSNNGILDDLTYNSWGEKIADGTQLYDNIGNFFRNGAVWDNSVSVSGGSKNNSFFLSMSNYDQQGIVRETGYNKTTVRFNGEQKYGRLTVGANVSYSIADTDKTLTSAGLYDSGGNGTMTALYSWPQTEDMAKYLKEDGTKYRLFEGRLDLASDKEMENPYWIINKNKLTDQTKRFTGAMNTSFEITDWWNVSARVGYDQYTTEAYTYIAPEAVGREMYQNGRLNKSDYNYSYITTNIMTNFQKTFGDFDFGLLLGTTSESTEWHNQTHWGYDFITAGTISFNNIATENQFFKDRTQKKRMVGAFGELRAAYKNIAYLTVTGRNDWASTLPKDRRSYFYPSVSGSLVFTELLPKNNILTFGKVRASWAEVGKDSSPYVTTTYVNSPYTYDRFYLIGNSWGAGNRYLKPEIQTAWEIGTELRFLNGRLGLDYTYYHSSTKNQIASPRLSNAKGYIFSSINSGSVINKGMEIAITGKPFVGKDFEWEVVLNASYNRGTLGDFLSGVNMFYPTDAQFGSVKSASIPNGGDFLGLVGTRYSYQITGKKEGGVDTRKEMESGSYYIDPKTGLYKISENTAAIVGNREPKLIGGLNNTLRYKDLTVSFLFDFRLGGDVYNGTEYYMLEKGLSKRTLLNDRQSVTFSGAYNIGTEEVPVFEERTITYEAGKEYVINGVTYSGKAMIQKYWENYNKHSYNYIQSVNWLKLRSLSVSYDFTKLMRKQHIVKRLVVTATGTNLFTWTNYDGMDPEVSTAGGTGGSGATGIDYCSVPATSGFSFGVNLTF